EVTAHADPLAAERDVLARGHGEPPSRRASAPRTPLVNHRGAMRRWPRVRTTLALPLRGLEQPRARRLARTLPRVLRGRAPARHARDRPLRARVPLRGARRLPRALSHALGGGVSRPRDGARARAQGRARAEGAGPDLAGSGGGVPPVRLRARGRC